ncbi:hypothetical protein DFR86_05105 [Acidianus sulfidivorans JP7]|uniref:Uncharacterized protein n=1 Tax=Acidianus sulfidivorans JP7 TaxID=619593 RepID=A0A2U9ILS2_9CREN|nr:hypothetical protein [Acidianus sulfidivorans]AWR96998.1 hypothetical protein DFR86_05105 [Acidianus sulfidivorans JP7]
MNFKGIAIGLIIFVIGFASYITLPKYFPNYSYVEGVYNTHETSVMIPAGADKIVMQFNITKNNNSIVAFIVKGGGNITILNGTPPKIIENQANIVSVALSPGEYYLGIINNSTDAENVTYTYGIFPASLISSFYSGLGVMTTITEIVTFGGIAIAFIAFIYELLSRKKRS